MDVHISLSGRGDLAARIYRQLLEAILDGRLLAGEQLPPSRELARQLEVSRNTVAVAYERLTAEGFCEGRVGAGTFVTARSGAATGSRRAPVGDALQPLRVWESVDVRLGTEPAAVPFDFSVGIPDVRLFPFDSWRQLLSREYRPSMVRSAGYGDPAGHPGLRAEIARYVGVSRSVRAGASDVLVTHGAQQAFDVIGRVLVSPRSVVAVEEPGYPPARELFRSLGARVVGVPVDASGISIEALPSSARLVYVTPSHQFPTGTPMSLERRSALLDWANRRNAVIVEDDYDSEFRYSDRPLEPLQSIDRGGRVIYVGSFSKTLLPMLRLGFLVAPASLQPALRKAKQLTDWHTETPLQAALARFIAEGLLGRHVRKATKEYAARRSQIVSGLEHYLGPWLAPVPSAAGLHVCARLRRPASLSDVVAKALEAGVRVETLASYCMGKPEQGLVMGYGAIAPDRIERGLRRLARCFP